MALTIKWSDEAKGKFEENIIYLQNEWSDREIRNFIKHTSHIISRIEKYPEIFTPSKKKKLIRKAKVNKHIDLYFRHDPDKKEVILLSFWHNKQDSSKLKY